MIVIAGAISGAEPVFTQADIEAALQCPQALEHNATFTGRPATQLFVGERAVVKLRSDFVFQHKDRLKRALAALEAERQLGAHHPDKTWFVIESEDSATIGNIAPRLLPVHQYFKQPPVPDNLEILSVLNSIFQLYCGTVRKADRRLDEGLSNFGLDGNGQVFYLDDDSYDWDEFTSLASVLGVWIRQLSSLTVDDMRTLGGLLAGAVLVGFESVHPLRVLYGQLRNNLTVSERDQQCIAALMEPLAQASKVRSPMLTTSMDGMSTRVNVKLLPSVSPPPILASHLMEKISATRFAVLADIHANLPALQAVLAWLDQEGIDELLLLGDVVGYGPQPRQCIDLLAQRRCVVVQGNHDYATATGDVARGFSKLAKWSIEWTRANLPEPYLEWLGALSPVHRQDNWIAVHGAPVDKAYFYAYVYHMTYQANLDWLAENQLKIGFHGHSHLQAVYRRGKNDDSRDEGVELALADDRCCLVCPGSVGQPRDGKIAAEFALYDTERQLLTQHHVNYAVTDTVATMKQLNFPQQLHERLLTGS